MAPVSWRRWGHRLANLILFALYCPANFLTPLLILDLSEHLAELMHPWVALAALISCAFVNAGLLLTIFAARRLNPVALTTVRLLLFVYALPHMLLVSVLAPGSMPDAWIP